MTGSGAPLVSIIMPVYNAEHFLAESIESALNQTYDRFELLLVNDGSSDRSGELCDRYAALDPRVRVIHQENRGPSAARNAGIEFSSGKYLQFLDADDSLDLLATETLVKAAVEHGTDLVICSFRSVITSGEGNQVTGRPLVLPVGVKRRAEFLSSFYSLLESGALVPVFNKLYRTDIVWDNAIEFKVAWSMGEDAAFNLDYIRYAESISLISEELYNYRIDNLESLTKNLKFDYLLGLLDRNDNLRKVLTELDVFEFNKDRYFSAAMNSIHAGLIKITAVELVPRRDVVEQLRRLLRDERVIEYAACAPRSRAAIELLRLGVKGRTVSILYCSYRLRLEVARMIRQVKRLRRSARRVLSPGAAGRIEA